jgi:hypothetical protein
MLGDFLRRHEIDIALLQEVTTLRLNDIQHYTAYINFGIELRGTAILTKHGITLTNIKRLPCGRGYSWLIAEHLDPKCICPVWSGKTRH